MKTPLVFAPRVQVTPDPDAAAALLRKLEALSYRPGNGFHRDTYQSKPQRVPAKLPANVLPMLLRKQAG
jgi:hypothetical protein